MFFFNNETFNEKNIKSKDDVILRALLNTSDLEPQMIDIKSVFDY